MKTDKWSIDITVLYKTGSVRTAYGKQTSHFIIHVGLSMMSVTCVFFMRDEHFLAKVERATHALPPSFDTFWQNFQQ